MPSQALRLYQITDTAASGKDRAVPGAYFSDKKLAKAKRQELNGDEGDGRKQGGESGDKAFAIHGPGSMATGERR